MLWLFSASSTDDSVALYFKRYNATLSSMLEHHAPLKVVTKTLRPTVPWYNELIVCTRKLRRKAERKWRRTRTMEDLQVFKTRRNVTFLLNKARRECYSELQMRSLALKRT